MFVTLRIFLIATFALWLASPLASADTTQLKSSWEWVLAQQKVPPASTSTPPLPLISTSVPPSSIPTQQLPSYLISKKPLFPEFDFTST